MVLTSCFSLQILNVFKFDGEYEANEEKYGAIKTELLGDDSGIFRYSRHFFLSFTMKLYKIYIFMTLLLKYSTSSEVTKHKLAMRGKMNVFYVK